MHLDDMQNGQLDGDLSENRQIRQTTMWLEQQFDHLLMAATEEIIDLLWTGIGLITYRSVTVLNPSETQSCDTQGWYHIQIFATTEALLAFEALPVPHKLGNSCIQVLGNHMQSVSYYFSPLLAWNLPSRWD